MNADHDAPDELDHEMPACEALGRIEAKADGDLRVVEALCGPDAAHPDTLTTGEWMGFVEAAHSYVEENTDMPEVRDGDD